MSLFDIKTTVYVYYLIDDTICKKFLYFISTMRRL